MDEKLCISMDRFVDRAQAEHLKCPICMCIAIDVKQVFNCNHIFCGACIDAWIARPEFSGGVLIPCPSCRRVFNSEMDVINNHVTHNMVNELKINCINVHNSCGFIGNVNNIEVHEAGCAWGNEDIIACTKCYEEVFVKNMKKHECIGEMSLKLSETERRVDKMVDRYVKQEEKFHELYKKLNQVIRHNNRLSDRLSIAEECLSNFLRTRHQNGTAHCRYCREPVSSDDLFMHQRNCVQGPHDVYPMGEIAAPVVPETTENIVNFINNQDIIEID